MKYSFKITILKGAKYFVIFGIPFLVNQFVITYPEWAQLTIGSLLVMLANWGKNWAGVKWL